MRKDFFKLLMVVSFAITMFPATATVNMLQTGSDIQSWGGVKARLANRELAINVDDKTENWSGLNVILKRAIDLSAENADGVLSFRLNNTGWFQIKLMGKDADNKSIDTKYVPVDKNSEVTISLADFQASTLSTITGYSIQFGEMKNAPNGITIRNLRYLPKGEEETQADININLLNKDNSASAWGAAKGFMNQMVINLTADEKTQDWSGVTYHYWQKIALPKGVENADLVFGVNTLASSNPPEILQINFTGKVDDQTKTTKTLNLKEVIPSWIDTDAQSWQKVKIPMDDILAGEKLSELNSITLQFGLINGKKASVIIKNISITNQD